MKVYLAGKIKANETTTSPHDGPIYQDWRDDVLTKPPSEVYHRCDIYSYADEWPIMDGAVLGKHDYVGPFYARHHNDTSHSICSYGCDSCDEERELQIVMNCLQAVKRADLVFANISPFDVSIGGCIEVGWAFQSNIRVVGYGHVTNETWFVRRMCSQWFDSARGSAADALRVSLRMVDYQEYIRSDKWRGLAERIKDERGRRCQVCNSKGQLDAHHRTYERLGWEEDNDITVLCRACHELYETNKRLPKPEGGK